MTNLCMNIKTIIKFKLNDCLKFKNLEKEIPLFRKIYRSFFC